jgi:hypothetical protein
VATCWGAGVRRGVRGGERLVGGGGGGGIQSSGFAMAPWRCGVLRWGGGALLPWVGGVRSEEGRPEQELPACAMEWRLQVGAGAGGGLAWASVIWTSELCRLAPAVPRRALTASTASSKASLVWDRRASTSSLAAGGTGEGAEEGCVCVARRGGGVRCRQSRRSQAGSGEGGRSGTLGGQHWAGRWNGVEGVQPMHGSRSC